VGEADFHQKDPAVRHLLAEAEAAAMRHRAAQEEADRQRVIFRDAVRRAKEAGATLRQIADATGVTFGRIHQIVGKD
jgi:hypothetical protein